MGSSRGEIDGLILWDVDPLRELPDPDGWKEALAAADFICEVGLFGNASGGHADVFLPAETHAEKEGTVTHPDGRIQRLRPSVPHPGATRHGWQWLAELAARLGHETGIDSAPEALAAIAEDVPFYAGLTHEEIGGTGVRWQEREAAEALRGESSVDFRSPEAPKSTLDDRSGANGGLRLGTYRDLWAAEVTERAPALRFLLPSQTLELSLTDSERLGVRQGDEVDVRSNGHSVKARVAVRERMRPGAGFLIEGLAEQSANVLAGAESDRDREGGPTDEPANCRRHLRRGHLGARGQVGDHLRRRLRDRAGLDRGRAQGPRPVPAPLRPEPDRPVRPGAAAGRRAEARRQGGV